MKTAIHIVIALLSIAAIATPSKDAHAFFDCGTFDPLIATTSALAFGTTTLLLTPIIGQAVDETMRTDNYDMAWGYVLTAGGVTTAGIASTIFVSTFNGCDGKFGSRNGWYTVGVPAIATIAGGLLMQPLVRALSSNKHNTQLTISPTFDQDTKINGAQGGLVISF